MQYSAEAAGTNGNIRCHVVRRRLAHERRARYSIVVCNETDADAQALAFVPDAPEVERRTVVQTIIGPHSDFTTTVALDLTRAGLLPELRVVLSNGDTQFTLEVPAVESDLAITDDAAPTAPERQAPAPLVTLRPAVPVAARVYTPPPFSQGRNGSAAGARWTPPAHARSSPSVTPIIAAFAVVAAAAAFVVGRPQLGDVAVPASAAPGTAVNVAYRATGLGTAAYAVVAPDGRTLQDGPLDLGSGTFAFTLPRTTGAPAYLVRIDVTSPLGSALAERYVRVAPPPVAATPRAVHVRAPAPAPAPPQIRSLALDRATLAGGETLTVYYDADAAGGTVTLLDPAAQIVYGRSDLNASGHAAFIAPHVDASRFLTVIATARRGRQTVESRIGVTVTPDDPAAAAARGAGQAGTDEAGAETAAPTTVISAPATARGGHHVRVDVAGATAGFELALLDGAGHELAERDVPAGEDGSDFIVPDVRVPTRYLFEATYPHGVGSETIVRPITVTP